MVASALGYEFATWPALRPHGVDVTGNHVVSAAQIVAKAAVEPNANIWLQNTRAMSARIESIPYVLTASVHRRLPAAVSIDVTERTPAAIVVVNGSRAVIDHTLRVLTADDSVQRSLPTFVLRTAPPLKPGMFLNDDVLRHLRDDNDALVAAHVEPTALTTDRFGELIATLHNGVKLLLGDDDDLQKNIPLIEPILAQLERAGRPIAAIDLRAPNTPIVVYKK